MLWDRLLVKKEKGVVLGKNCKWLIARGGKIRFVEKDIEGGGLLEVDCERWSKGMFDWSG